VITQFAYSQPTLDAHWWPKGAAGHRTEFVEITSPIHRIERRARLVIAEGFEALALPFRGPEQTARRVSRKFSGPTRNCLSSPPLHSLRSRRVPPRKLTKPAPQPPRVELIDGKRTDTAGRTSHPASEPIPTPPFGISQRSVDDLNQFLISGGWKAKCHNLRIPIRGIMPQLPL